MAVVEASPCVPHAPPQYRLWELGPTAEEANPVLLPEPRHLPQAKGKGCSDCGRREGRQGS